MLVTFFDAGDKIVTLVVDILKNKKIVGKLYLL